MRPTWGRSPSSTTTRWTASPTSYAARTGSWESPPGTRSCSPTISGSSISQETTGTPGTESTWEGSKRRFSTKLAHSDYSIKPVKPVIAMEMQTMEEIQAEIVAPFFYGAMPNQGLYYAPDGPYGNPADLMREFKIEESMQQSELASAHVTRDIEYVATRMQAAGSDGFNFDTTGSAGDADCVGTLNGVKKLREQCPEAYIQVGFAGESIMGIHGSIEFEGQVVAGMYPHQYVHLAEKAGANVCGTVVNTNTSKSLAFNIARAVTFIKEAVKDSNIPIHADMGMGVGGIPMCETPPIDAVSRASKAMVEIAGVDGI